MWTIMGEVRGCMLERLRIEIASIRDLSIYLFVPTTVALLSDYIHESSRLGAQAQIRYIYEYHDIGQSVDSMRLRLRKQFNVS